MDDETTKLLEELFVIAPTLHDVALQLTADGLWSVVITLPIRSKTTTRIVHLTPVPDVRQALANAREFVLPRGDAAFV